MPRPKVPVLPAITRFPKAVEPGRNLMNELRKAKGIRKLPMRVAAFDLKACSGLPCVPQEPQIGGIKDCSP
jgi:hypothetical protein